MKRKGRDSCPGLEQGTQSANNRRGRKGPCGKVVNADEPGCSMVVLARLLEKVLYFALFLLEGAALLIRTALAFRLLVAGYGAGGFFCPALELVHRSFALVLAAALSTHVLLLSFSTTRQYHGAPKELPEVSAG